LKKIALILLVFSLSITQEYIHKCGSFQGQSRNSRPDYLDNSINSPSGDFRIHYDVSGPHAATTTYINAVGQAADDAKNLLEGMGFLFVIDDADGVFDIYLSNLPMGSYGYNAADCGGYYTSSLEYYCENDEVSGASYIVIDNNFDYSCSNFLPSYLCVNDNTGIDVMKVTLVHEYFHAVQRAYLEPLALEQLNDTYFMELISTWVEDVAYPDVSDYLNFTYPYLQTPELNISDYDPDPSSDTDAGYSLALFGHYLTKIYDDVDNEEDGVIIKKILENFTGDYQGQARDAIDYVLINEYNSTFAQAWTDFNARNTFNSEFSDAYNQIYYYEDQKYINPILCSNNDCGSSWNANLNSSYLATSTSYDLINQEGAVSIKSYVVDQLSFLDFIFNIDNHIISEDFAGHVAIESTNSQRHRVYDLNNFLNYTCTSSQYNIVSDCESYGFVWEAVNSDIIALDNLDKIHIFGAFNGYEYTSYGNEYNLGFNLNYSNVDNYNLGDINLDNDVSIVDVISIINFILENMNISDYQFNLIDMNNDSNVNIIDVMTVVNIILDA